MSDNQEYQNIKEYLEQKIDIVMDNYYEGYYDNYKFTSEDLIYYSSCYQIISNKTGEIFTPEQINSLKNVINNINKEIKEVYNNNNEFKNEFKIGINHELIDDSKYVKIKCSIETNEDHLHDYLVEIFMSALSVFLCNYVRNNSGKIIMFKNTRIRIFFKCMSLFYDLIERGRLSPKIAMKLEPVIRNILFLKSSNALVVENIDIDNSKRMKPELRLEPEEDRDDPTLNY